MGARRLAAGLSGRIGRVLALLAVAGLVACGAEKSPSRYVTPWRLSGAETVTVTARDDKTNLRLIKPMSGRGGGALYGAGSAAAGAMELGTGCEGIGCALMVPIVLGAAVIGAGVGAATSHSERETKAAAAALMQGLREVEMSPDLEAYLVGPGRVGPSGPNLRRGRSGAALLQLTTRIGLGLTGSRIDPDVVVTLYTSGTLRRGGSKVTVVWSQSGPPVSYFKLAANDAALFKTVVRSVAAKMAKQIRAELSLAVVQRAGAR